MAGNTWPLRGRSAELALAREALTADEAYGVVLVGAVGVGKTRLAHEIVAAAGRAGHPTGWVAAAAAAAEIPFGATAALLGDGDLVTPHRVEVLRRVAARLRQRASDRRLVLGVDDGHLLDAASATLIHYVAAARVAFVVITIRAGEPVPDAVTTLWKDQVAQRIDVGPLSEADTIALLDEVCGGQVDSAAAHELFRLSGGSPLFLRELTEQARQRGTLVLAGGVWRHTGSLAMPSGTVGELGLAHLRAVDRAVREAVELVSLAEPAELRLLVAAGVSERAVEDAEEAGLLATVESGRRIVVRLAHPLYGELLRARMRVLRGQRLHRQLATALEATPLRRRDDLVRLARWQLAGGLKADQATLLAAAVRASVAMDRPQALRFAEAARRAGGGFPAGLLAAETLAWQGSAAEAERRFAPLADEAADDEQRVLVVRARALNLGLGLGRLRAAEAVVDEAAPLVHDPVCLAEVLGVKVILALHANLPRRAGELLLELPQVSPPPRLVLASIPTVVVLQTLSGFPDQATGFAEHGLAQLAEADTPEAGWLADMTERALVDAHLLAGRLDAAATIAARRHRQALDYRSDDHRAVWALVRGTVSFAAGQLRTARHWLREAAGLVDAGPPRTGPAGRLLCHGLLAQVEAQRGDAPAAAQALRALTDAPDDILVPDARLAYAWEAASRGAIVDARRLAAETADACRAEGHVPGQLRALHDLARLGDPTSAVDGLASLAVEGAAAAAITAHCTALAHRDAVALDRASAELERLGMVLLAAEAAAQAAAAHRDAGRGLRAIAVAETARTLAARCEGARTPALRASGTGRLSERELQVALLAAAGSTNRMIADQLAISLRTVENHLHNVFGKLDVTRRGELRELLGPDQSM